ncbi:hypothetical protein ACF0H5_024109 [Mactra antiquata]
MSSSGLLILSQPLSHVTRNLPHYLTELSKLVTKTAYIHVQPGLIATPCSSKDPSELFNFIQEPLTLDVRRIVKDVYVSSVKFCQNLDVKVLVGHFGKPGIKYPKYCFFDPCGFVLVDSEVREEEKFIELLKEQFGIKDDCKILQQLFECDTEEKKLKLDDETSEVIQQYGHTVLGGTFDRLHVGHKILLTEGCILGTSELTVGVTDGQVNDKKTLRELIEPVEERVAVVKQFLTEIKPSLDYNVVPIYDVYGPTITDQSMNFIVLSDETRKGGAMVNEKRQDLGMNKLDECVIELVEDLQHSEYEENKVSSSSLRKRLLGTLYNPIKEKDGLNTTPYIIGLTGGIASGKSSVCKRLELLGAKIVDCDKLGHKAYIKGSPGFDKLVKEFGEQVIGENGEIDRKQLGKIVFGDKDCLQKLNSLIWPEIANLAEQQILEFKNDNCDVVILDAAVLLEANWDQMCHEVWTTIVPQQEAIKRIVERNNLTGEQAEQRVKSQISNSDRVNKANVILCTLWEYDYTQQQVEKAWQLLQDRLPK